VRLLRAGRGTDIEVSRGCHGPAEIGTAAGRTVLRDLGRDHTNLAGVERGQGSYQSCGRVKVVP